MSNYAYGQTARLEATFRDEDDNVADPTTVTLWVENPSGTETSYTYAGATVSKESTGVYYKNFRWDAEGTWRYRWIGTGAVQQETPDVTVTVGSTVFGSI